MFTLARDLVHLLKLITEKVYQGMWNLFKIDNKDIKKEHGKDMFTVHQKNTWEKVLGILQFVNKETQSLLLTLTDFTSYLRVSVVDFE